MSIAKEVYKNMECQSRDKIKEFLNKKYSEKPFIIGIQNEGFLMEIFRNDETLSWTIVLTDGKGISCFAISGGSIRGTILEPEGPGA